MDAVAGRSTMSHVTLLTAIVRANGSRRAQGDRLASAQAGEMLESTSKISCPTEKSQTGGEPGGDYPDRLLTQGQPSLTPAERTPGHKSLLKFHGPHSDLLAWVEVDDLVHAAVGPQRPLTGTAAGRDGRFDHKPYDCVDEMNLAGTETRPYPLSRGASLATAKSTLPWTPPVELFPPDLDDPGEACFDELPADAWAPWRWRGGPMGGWGVWLSYGSAPAKRGVVVAVVALDLVGAATMPAAHLHHVDVVFRLGAQRLKQLL